MTTPDTNDAREIADYLAGSMGRWHSGAPAMLRALADELERMRAELHAQHAEMARRQANESASFLEVSDMAAKALKREHDLLGELERLRAQVAPAEPFWYAIVSERVPVINSTRKRADLAEELADKLRETWPDVEIVPLYRAAPAPQADPLQALSDTVLPGEYEAQQAEPLSSNPDLLHSALSSNPSLTVGERAGHPEQFEPVAHISGTARRKVADLVAQGYRVCGYTMERDGDRSAVVFDAAVRWLTDEQRHALMFVEGSVVSNPPAQGVGDEQAAFEAEVRNWIDGARADAVLRRGKDGAYEDLGAVLAWECWQARAALAQAQKEQP